MATATAAALPDWVMLERFVFRRDDPNSFRGDKRTFATCKTSSGARFDVSFVLAEPPTPSRIYLSWPDGPKEKMGCHLIAAHRDLVLLRLDSFVDRSAGLDYRHEYFIYIAHPSFPPLLRLLPQCMKYHVVLEKMVTCPLHQLSVGLLCHGEDEFAVAHLSIHIPRHNPELKLKAELWVLRSSRSSCCAGVAAGNWERKLLPIQYKDSSEHHDLLYWVVDEVVPFNNSMCWVNHAAGVLFCDNILGDSPRVSYARFPVDRFAGNDPWGINKEKEPYRSLCVTDDGGSRLAFVGVTSHDDAKLGPRVAFTFTVRTLELLEDGTVLWQSIDEAAKVVITSAQLRDASNSMCLPLSQDPMDPMVYPLLRTDVSNIVHAVLFDSKVGRMSLVAIDLSDSKVLGSVVPYIKSWNQGLCADDDDMAKTKPIFFVRFLPSEFPKFLNRNTGPSDESTSTSLVQVSQKQVPTLICT